METFTVGTRLLARFSPDGPTSRLLYRSDHQQVRVLGFEPWQAVTTWPTDADVTITVLEGTGELSVGDEVLTVSAGDLCVVPAGTAGAIRSRGRRLIVTEVLSPVPTAWRLDVVATYPDGVSGHPHEPAVPQPAAI